MPRNPNAHQALAVLTMEPRGFDMPTARVQAMCEGIPGVGAMWVDANRGRIHILYDGSPSAIEELERAVRFPGLRIRLLGNGISPAPLAPDTALRR